jgi:hypothetical protein
VVAVKTLAATAMVGAQTTINNQLKAVTATAMETAMMKATTMTMKTKAAAARRQRVGGGQLGGCSDCDNTSNGNGNEGGKKMTAATMAMGRVTAPRTWRITQCLERGG